MKYSTFAGTEIKLSKLCFGAMGLNCAFGKYEEKDLITSLHNCLDQGVNIIDTARIYGDSERIVGLFLKEYKGPKPFIATKASPSSLSSNNGWGISNPIEMAYPKGSVTKSLEKSLKELDVDNVDLFQLHQYWSEYEEGY